MLVISGLIAGYEDAGIVLEGIDLEVGAGESVALMGRNGMGKTTLLRAIMGHVRPTAGRVAFDSFKNRSDEITNALNSALSAILGGQSGMEDSFATGDQESADNAQQRMASANFDAARFSSRA